MAGVAVHPRVVDAAPLERAATARPRATGARVRGPLVAICGLCGGAGASTLAYLLSRWSLTTRSDGHVLAMDVGTGTAGLSFYAGVSSSRSLTELAEDARAGGFIGQPFAVADDGLRVLATAPRGEPSVPHPMLARVVEDARRAHRLTFADCGTAASAAGRLMLESASHVIWVLPATPSAVARAQVMLASLPAVAGMEVVVARHDSTARKATNRALTELAAARRAPIVLMPSVSSLTEKPFETAMGQCSMTLDAIGTLLRL